MVILILIIIAIIFLCILSSKKEKEKREKYNIPSNAIKIKQYDSTNLFGDKKYFWDTSKSLIFCDCKFPTTRIEIKKDNILSFAMIGEYKQTTTVKGGGTSLTGAAVGGALFGGVGAVVGSRKKVKQETHTTDTRKTVLSYKYESIERSIILSKEMYDKLTIIKPSKRV